MSIFEKVLVVTFKTAQCSPHRFWFENQQFTSDQLNQLMKISFGKMLCDNGDNIRSRNRILFRLLIVTVQK